MPVLFIGHGSPSNAFENNQYSREWHRIATLLPKPRAILVISAHHVTNGSQITTTIHPETIHDFFGFPDHYYDFQYPAPGDPLLASHIQQHLTPQKITEDDARGLDHGAWSVLTHLFPEADVPVVQLSINGQASMTEHFTFGQSLRFLRDEDVLIIGSGNIVHHLGLIRWGGDPYPWASNFDTTVREQIRSGNFQSLIRYAEIKDAHLAVPTPEHFIPLLFILGATQDETPHFFNESIFASSLSMTGVLFR